MDAAISWRLYQITPSNAAKTAAAIFFFMGHLLVDFWLEFYHTSKKMRRLLTWGLFLVSYLRMWLRTWIIVDFGAPINIIDVLFFHCDAVLIWVATV